LSALLATDETYLKTEGLSLAHIKGAIPVSGVYVLQDWPVFDGVFGKDLKIRQHASPVNHVKGTKPPFLILVADTEFPACERPNAEAFFKGDRPAKPHLDPVERRQPRNRPRHAPHAELHPVAGDRRTAGQRRAAGRG
jgi:hypothetical protein